MYHDALRRCNIVKKGVILPQDIFSKKMNLHEKKWTRKCGHYESAFLAQTKEKRFHKCTSKSDVSVHLVFSFVR